MISFPYRYKKNSSSFAYYWNEGLGKDLLNKLDKPLDLKDADQFVPYLNKWDHTADQLVLDLHQKIGFDKGNAILFKYIDGNYIDPPTKQVLDQFFSSLSVEPDWVDFERIERGSELSRRVGILGMIILRDYCLMGGYESAAINKPLIYTGALKKGPVKRLADTVEFWVQITKSNALRKDAFGFKQVLLTRMIHSYARINILQKTDYDTQKWGIPINLWDLLATQLGFSLVFLVGLRRAGFEPTEEEVDGLFHMWKYIGYLIGIPLHLLPETEAEAIEALYYWTMTQIDGDEDSRQLADALKEEPLQAKYPTNELMRRFMREVHLYYNYYFLGTYSCKTLGLPTTKIGRLGFVNILKHRKLEKNMHLKPIRDQAIAEGGDEQENVRLIYEKYNQ